MAEPSSSKLPIQPFQSSRLWIASAADALDHPDALLVVRLGLALNAIMAQHAFAASTIEKGGASGSRDTWTALAIAAGLAEEARIVINGNYKAVLSLASAGGASDQLLKQFGELNSRKAPRGRVLNVVRNKLTFHWDPACVAASLADFRADHDPVIWLEAHDQTRGNAVCRLSMDVLMNAICPEPSEVKNLNPEERKRAIVEMVEVEISQLRESMDLVADVIRHAISGFLLKIKTDAHQRD
jgi:hypothetical protein